jgi:hypothetical protein
MRSHVFADVGVERYLIAYGSTTMSPSSLLRASPGTPRPASIGRATRSLKGEAWWSQTESNRRPHACKARALPAELWPRI